MHHKKSTNPILGALACLLLALPASNVMALQVSPKGFSEPEGTIVQLNITLSGNDWVTPTEAFANQCANIGVFGRHVARYLLRRIDGSGSFSTSATKGDLHLAGHGRPGGDLTVLYCSPSIEKPTLTDTTATVHLHVDDLEELTETAKLELYRLDLSGNRTLVTTVEIAIEDATSGQNSNACSETELAGDNPSAEGSLATSDCDDSPRGGGYLADRFNFVGTKDQTIAIDAEWTGLDGYLYLQAPGGSIEAENDDDDGDASRSRISRSLGRSGTYTLWVTSKTLGATGNYSLSLSAGASTPTCEGRALECGSTLAGELSGSSCTNGPQGPEFPVEAFTFTGEAGQSVWLRADWDFDGYLFLEDPQGRVIAENDNHKGVSDSAIEHRLPADGTYAMWASSYEPGASGAFDVTLDCDPPAGPDLAVEAPQLTDASLAPGEVFDVSVQLGNPGDAPADSTVLHYLVSSDAIIDRSDAEVFAMTAPALAAAGSIAIGNDANVRAPGAPGNYWLGVCADVVVAEGSVTNNCSAATPFEVSAQPLCTRRQFACDQTLSGNLGSQDCAASPRGAGYLAEVLEVEVEQGAALVAAATWTGVDGYLMVEDPSGAVVASNDDVGGSSQSAIEYTPESGGFHRIWVTTRERGDAGGYEVALDCGSASDPDLVASVVSAVNDDVVTSQSLEVSASIRNEGGSDSGATQVSLVLSPDREISPDDTVLTSQPLAAIAAGSTSTYSVVSEAPGEPGTYWLGVCVDAVAGESVTRNNCSPAGTAASAIRVTNGSNCSANSLGCGETWSATLGENDCDRSPRGGGFAADSLAFTGVAGERISVSADWSGFDGYLYLEAPDGSVEAENDDAQGDDSRIDHVLEHSGIYLVWPTTHHQGAGGSYELRLDCGLPDGPRLGVAEPELSATSVRRQQTVSVTVEVSNEGDEEAAATNLHYFLVAAPPVSADARRLGRSDVEALPAGSSEEEEFSIPIDAVPGTYRIAVCLDAEPFETGQGGNCSYSNPLTVEATERPIDLNAGMNDAWYNPATPGQGFFINVFPDSNQVFVSWFTYDVERPGADAEYELGDPGHRWFVALGTFERGIATLDLYLNEGGLFDSADPVPSESLYGSMTLRFSDCNHGEVTFDFPSAGEQGVIPITRVATDNLRACQERAGELKDLAAAPPAAAETGTPVQVNPGFNDAWFNPATSGQGFSFNVFPSLGTVFLSWFTYDTEAVSGDETAVIGDPGLRWLTALGRLDGQRAALALSRVSGGEFNAETPVSEEADYGTVDVRFDDCNSGELEYDIPSLSLHGTVPIRRLSRDNIPGCEQADMAHDEDVRGVSPGDKFVLENFCGGTASWNFNWPDAPYASSYVLELWRNDALVPMRFEVKESEFRYEKETEVPPEHRADWRWRYQSRSAASGITSAFSPFLTFDVGDCGE